MCTANVERVKIDSYRYFGLSTSACGLEVGATVAELEARVIAVARFVRGILDDGVDRRLLDDARRVPARTAEFRLEAAARAGDGRGERQQDGGGNGDGGTTSHRR